MEWVAEPAACLSITACLMHWGVFACWESFRTVEPSHSLSLTHYEST